MRRAEDKDCRKRWFYTLDPGLRKGRWTREEDITLRAAYSELGPQWREIGQSCSSSLGLDLAEMKYSFPNTRSER
jgi:myb proto-oncogene protein